METFPTILTVAFRGSNPENLIKLILGNENSDRPLGDAEPSYSWCIDNKYYSAKVQFHPVSFSNVADLENDIEAVIVFFDCVLERNFLIEVNRLIDHLKNNMPPIQILACSRAVQEKDRPSVEDWCIRNRYELVELEPLLSFERPEEDVNECCGIDRVKEILHAHHWPNLIAKEKTSPMPSHFSHLDDFKPPQSEEKLLKKFLVNGADDDINVEESWDDMEKLSTLFRDLQTLKQDITSLTGEEKFKQAEKVVKTFWRAMHGDSDEFSQSEDEL